MNKQKIRILIRQNISRKNTKEPFRVWLPNKVPIEQYIEKYNNVMDKGGYPIHFIIFKYY